MSNILILGASGFIGKALSLELARENKIIAFGNYEAEELHENKNITSVIGSFSKQQDFAGLLKSIDVVIHLISTTTPNDNTVDIPFEIEENVIPTVRLLEDMIRCGTKKIIFASSAGAIYGETGRLINNIATPPNPYCSYGVQKATIEMYIKFYGIRYGLDYRIMRISNPYGLGQDSKKTQGLIPILVRNLLSGKSISIFGDGANMRDYIFLLDLIKGINAVLNYTGEERIFNLGYGRYYSINDVIKIIEELGERKFQNINILPNRFCDIQESYVDMEQCHKELNWFPKTELRQGIKLIFQSFSR